MSAPGIQRTQERTPIRRRSVALSQPAQSVTVLAPRRPLTHTPRKHAYPEDFRVDYPAVSPRLPAGRDLHAKLGTASFALQGLFQGRPVRPAHSQHTHGQAFGSAGKVAPGKGAEEIPLRLL